MRMRFVAFLLSVASLAYLPAVSGHGQKTHEAPTGEAKTTVEPIVVSGDRIPQLALAITKDSSGALAARIDVTRFRFTPQTGGNGDGHALLTVDGDTVAAMRSAQAPLPALARGSHEVGVALVGNDGAPYVSDGRPLAARVVYRVSGTGAGTPRAFALDITNGHVARDTLRVTQGDSVQLRWRSDAALDLHLHGYDIEARVAPGDPVTMQFEADIGGRFPVALHDAQDAGGEGGHGHRALMYLEVYPD